MRLDNRRVNAQAKIEANDVIDGFRILIQNNEAHWITNSLPPAQIAPDKIAPDLVHAFLDNPNGFVRFFIVAPSTKGVQIIAPSVYSVTDGTIVIDIGTVIAEKKLNIDTNTAVITIV